MRFLKVRSRRGNLQDYYELLGISQDATSEEIKRAYRQKLKIYHPDNNSSLEAKQILTKFTLAYQTLISYDARRQYDSVLCYSRNVDFYSDIRANFLKVYYQYQKCYQKHQEDYKEFCKQKKRD